MDSGTEEEDNGLTVPSAWQKPDKLYFFKNGRRSTAQLQSFQSS